MADSTSKGWLISLALAVVGILGALLGNMISHRLTVGRDVVQRQSDAFVAFLNAYEKRRLVDEGGMDKNVAEQLNREYQVEAGAAARRIAVYGQVEVVKAMAEFYRTRRDKLLPCDGVDLKAELAIWESMRRVLIGDDFDRNDFLTVAGRCNPSISAKSAAQPGVAADGAAPRR